MVKAVTLVHATTEVLPKVARLHRPLDIKSNNPQMQEANKLVDPFTTINLVLWFDFVDSVFEGNTYTFHNIRVTKNKQTGDICQHCLV